MDFKGFLGVLGTLRDFNLTQLCTNFVLVSSISAFSQSIGILKLMLHCMRYLVPPPGRPLASIEKVPKGS